MWTILGDHILIIERETAPSDSSKYVQPFELVEPSVPDEPNAPFDPSRSPGLQLPSRLHAGVSGPHGPRDFLVFLILSRRSHSFGDLQRGIRPLVPSPGKVDRLPRNRPGDGGVGAAPSTPRIRCWSVSILSNGGRAPNAPVLLSSPSDPSPVSAGLCGGAPPPHRPRSTENGLPLWTPLTSVRIPRGGRGGCPTTHQETEIRWGLLITLR